MIARTRLYILHAFMLSVKNDTVLRIKVAGTRSVSSNTEIGEYNVYVLF